MDRLQLKCRLATFASDNGLKMKPGQLDTFVGTWAAGAMPFDLAAAEFKAFVLHDTNFARRMKNREMRRKAKVVEVALMGPQEPKRQRRRRPSVRELRAAGRDFVGDSFDRFEAGEIDGQDEARDIARSMLYDFAASVQEAAADVIFDGMCKELARKKARSRK